MSAARSRARLPGRPRASRSRNRRDRRAPPGRCRRRSGRPVAPMPARRARGRRGPRALAKAAARPRPAAAARTAHAWRRCRRHHSAETDCRPRPRVPARGAQPRSRPRRSSQARHRRRVGALIVSLSAVVFGGLIGVPFGAAVALTRFPGREAVIVILNALMRLPPVVVGLAIYLLLSRSGPLGAWGLLFTPQAMIVAQTVPHRSSRR